MRLVHGFSRVQAMLAKMQKLMIRRDTANKALPTRTFSASAGFKSLKPKRKESSSRSGWGPPSFFLALDQEVHGVPSQTKTTLWVLMNDKSLSRTFSWRRSLLLPNSLSTAKTWKPSCTKDLDNLQQPAKTSMTHTGSLFKGFKG